MSDKLYFHVSEDCNGEFHALYGSDFEDFRSMGEVRSKALVLSLPIRLRRLLYQAFPTREEAAEAVAKLDYATRHPEEFTNEPQD